MPPLIHQRCLNHYDREAVARCTGCRACFCRECISEHEERVLCAACLRKSVAAKPQARHGLINLLRVVQWVGGLALAWLFFYAIGESLLSLPSSFHEGTIWHPHWLESK